MLERKRRRLNENNPNKNQYGGSQSDAPLIKKSTVNSINKSAMIIQGPADDDGKTSREKRGQRRC